MKITFKDEALSELYETGKTKDRKYKQLCKNKRLVDGYIRAVGVMYRTATTQELRQYSFLITRNWLMIQEVRSESSMAWLSACCLQKRMTE